MRVMRMPLSQIVRAANPFETMTEVQVPVGASILAFTADSGDVPTLHLSFDPEVTEKQTWTIVTRPPRLDIPARAEFIGRGGIGRGDYYMFLLHPQEPTEAPIVQSSEGEPAGAEIDAPAAGKRGRKHVMHPVPRG